MISLFAIKPIRSRRPFFKSRFGKYLFTATIAIVVATLIFLFKPLGKIFAFVHLPMSFLMILGFSMAIYISTAELAKNILSKDEFLRDLLLKLQFRKRIT